MAVVVTALKTAGQHDLFTADEDYFVVVVVSVLPSNPQQVSLENYSVCSFQVLSHRMILQNPQSCNRRLGWSDRNRMRLCVRDGASVVGKSRSAVISTWGRIFVCDLQHRSLSQTPHKLGYLNFTLCVCVFWAWLSRSCSGANAALILQPEAKAEEHRCFIMASFITSGTAWHRSRSRSFTHHLLLPSALTLHSVQMQRSLTHLLHLSLLISLSEHTSQTLPHSHITSLYLSLTPHPLFPIFN